MPLKTLTLEFKPFRDTELLRSIKTLETIQNKPAAEFWKEVEEKQAAFEAWTKQVAGMSAEKQVEAVAKKLMELNPGFDGKVTDIGGGHTPKIENGVVTGIGLVTDHVTDISPVRALSQLKGLWCVSSTKPGTLRDLSPLKGMLLKELWLDFKPERDTELLRSIKTLQTINGKPAAEFWKQFKASVTFLADLSPVWKTQVHPYFSTDGTFEGRKYLVQGKESPNGILLHPPFEGFSEIVYTLHRAFEKFESAVAIPGTGPGAGSALTFEVIGDDTVLWASKPIQEFNQPQSCEVNVKNVNALTLRVHCPGSHSDARAVWFEPRLSARGLLPPKWDVERSAAEWVLSLGRNVGIRVARQERGIAGSGTLPAENFVLERIDLRDKPITAADLARLEGLTSLHVLGLKGCRVGDAGLAHLKNLTGLSQLDVAGAGISDAGLAHLKDLNQLRFLGLWANPEVTGAGLSHLAQLTKLEHLDLNATRTTNNGLEHLRNLSSLKHLNLDVTAVNDAGMPFIEGLTNLRVLHLNGCKIGDAGLARLKGLTNLEVLGLDWTLISDAGLTHLETLSKLTNLGIHGTKVSDEGLRHVARLTGLQALHLERSNVSDDGMPFIEGLTNLRALFFAGSKIGDAGLARLKGLTNLEVLGLEGTLITDAGLEHLETLSKLTVLEMGGTKVSDEGLRHVARLTGLQRLGLDRSNVSDAGIDSLLTLRKLHYLHVKETRISAAGFARLKEAFSKADLAWSLK